ncbi:hypothetical protein LguiB_013526 [Lonicera macranthoides]
MVCSSFYTSKKHNTLTLSLESLIPSPIHLATACWPALVDDACLPAYNNIFHFIRRYSLPPYYKNEWYKWMGSMLRARRTKLQRRYFNKYKTNAKKLAHVPPFVKREQLREFVKKESMTDAKRKSELGKVNRSKIGATHTSGRSSQAHDKVKAKHKELMQNASENIN